MSQISNGAVVTLECQGNIHPPGARFFLDGLTQSGGVKLSPRTDGVFTGTHWQCSELPEGTFTLACAGAIPGSRYLDGRTANATVGLAGDTLPPFSGAQWQILEVGSDVVRLQCLGTIEGNRFLDGNTINSTVGLAAAPDAQHSGVNWRVALSASPTLAVTTVRNQLGATLEMKGGGFTPRDSVNISAEGILGRNHQALALGSANTDGNGAFAINIDIRFPPVLSPYYDR